MHFRKYEEDKDFEYIASWLTEERTHVLWSAHRLAYPLTKEAFHVFLEQGAKEWGDKAYVYVDEDMGDVPVGFLVFAVNREEHFGFAKFIVVDGSRRGQGLGTRMISRLLECAFGDAQEMLSEVRLNVFDANPGAKRCYEKAGFVAESFTPDAIYLGEESWGRYLMVAKRADGK